MKGWVTNFGCLLTLFLIIGTLSGIGGAYWLQNNNLSERENWRLNGASPIRPPFLRTELNCLSRSEELVKLDVAVFELGQSAFAIEGNFESPVYQYVISYFAWHWKQADSRKVFCPPSEDLVMRLAPILDAIAWPQANTQLNDLRLIERLPPSKTRANGLGEIAFLPWIPPSDLGGEDSRPYARQLLADQGEFAAPWREAAFNEINGDTRLGTSAAYLAAAIDPAAALPIIEDVMDSKLKQSLARGTKVFQNGGDVSAIRGPDADRLIELGYSLARAGPMARSYSDPIIAMLDEVIARPSPPFGLMATSPTEFCHIADHIGGRVGSAANSRPFCSPDFTGGDGAPRNF